MSNLAVIASGGKEIPKLFSPKGFRNHTGTQRAAQGTRRWLMPAAYNVGVFQYANHVTFYIFGLFEMRSTCYSNG